MPKAIPTLGVTGWSNDFSAEADYILACYITTNPSDSILHFQQNTSMQYTLKVYSGNPLAIEEHMREDLLTKLQTIFGNTAEATVEVEAEDDSKPDNFSIRFTGTVYDSTTSYVVGRLVQFENGKVVKIAKINNG